MRRHRVVIADDGDVRVTLDIRVLSRNGLMRGEVEKIARVAVRRGADGVCGLPYTDFGPDNTRVRR